MALCPEFESLSYSEKVKMIGEVVHAVHFDSASFSLAQELLNLAKRKGVLDGVEILPDNPVINTSEQ